MPLVSIVVPIFNVEKYLFSCIDSILSQTFQDFELILVDDGSTDSSGEICDYYANSSEKLKVIHQLNKGVSVARNTGINQAVGKYLLYIDADDSIEPNMLNIMYSEAETGEYDLVVCGAKHYDEEGTFLFEELTKEFELNQEQTLRSLFEMPNPLGGCIWNKLFLKSKINDVRFKEGATMAEDRMYLFDAYLRIDKCKKIADTFYHVLEREDSATRKRTVIQTSEMLENSYHMLLKSRSHSLELVSFATDKFLDDCLLYIPEMIKKDSSDSFGFIIKNESRMKNVLKEALIKRTLSIRKIHGYAKAMHSFR